MGGNNSGGDVNDMVRLARLGRLYKVIRLMKLIRLLKLAKSGGSMFGKMRAMLHIGIGAERLFMFSGIFFLICHIVSCLWIIIASFEVDDPETWMEEKYQKLSNGNQYLTAFYFTITTITTVGYGDISAGTSTEKLGAIFLMLLGVISFSISSASLSSIFSSYDSSEAAIKEKMNMLQKL